MAVAIVTAMSSKGLDAGMDAMRDEARKVGADAIIKLRYDIAPPGTIGAGNIRYQGTAVRWK